MKIFTQNVQLLLKRKFVQLPLNIFFTCAPPSKNISCFLRNVWLLLKKNIKKKCAIASEKKPCAAAS